jgi:two-component system NtrC family sensor kinase
MIYRNVTEARQIERQLRQSQKLDAIGQLTGGVAHDFNNLLMVIGGSARKLQRSQPEAKHLRSLEMIELAVQKGESLTRKLLSFSRRRTLSPQVIDLAACILSLRGVLAQSVQGDIELDFRMPREPIAVKLDPSELEIALLNLTLNARDAMPDGGKIVIALDRVRSPSAGLPANLAGEFAAVTVTDSGVGVPADIRERIFEPFFTTKPVDKGTGLGLSQVFGFVNQSQGAVTVQSEGGHGARFTLFLPVSDEAPPPAAADARTPAASVEQARVLLVEDNPDVATVATDYLEQCGCRVVKANSAEAAVETLNRRKDIDLVFSDIVMPGMSGLELGRLVRDHHPEIPVVLASGYSDKAARAVEDGFVLLEKPYSLETLRRSLAVSIGKPVA